MGMWVGGWVGGYLTDPPPPRARGDERFLGPWVSRRSGWVAPPSPVAIQNPGKGPTPRAVPFWVPMIGLPCHECT